MVNSSTGKMTWKFEDHTEEIIDLYANNYENAKHYKIVATDTFTIPGRSHDIITCKILGYVEEYTDLTEIEEFQVVKALAMSIKNKLSNVFQMG